MSVFAGLETFLYILSVILYYPVIAGLVLLTFWMIICFGGFLREYIERRQGKFYALQRYKTALEEELRSICYSAGKDNSSNTEISARLERLLQKFELELIKSRDKISFAIRVGPALGLMGTLIPMGVALASLAQGDMPKMASNMVTAFNATTVGLANGVISYLMSLVKERWVRKDIKEMEYLTEIAFHRLKFKTLEPENLRKEVDIDEILKE
jgi:biopolymer transport protein ExbB/TolQ